MVSAGDLVRASDPEVKIAGDKQTAGSATFTTTETEVIWATGALLDGATYAIRLDLKIASTVAGDDVTVQIREDSATGTVLQSLRDDILSTSFPRNFPLYAEYTASATGSKQFVGTAVRSSGTGNISRSASSTSPSYLTVTRIA